MEENPAGTSTDRVSSFSSRVREICYLFTVVLKRFANNFREKGLVHSAHILVSTIFQLLASPFFVWSRGRKRFEFEGHSYAYFCHWYNLTFNNERAIEIALSCCLIDKFQPDQILEIGAVLPNYFSHRHLVIDKYEPGSRIDNVDIINFSTSKRYSLIIAISTLEHIGFDEVPRDEEKVIRAVEVIKHHLTDNGLFVATIPIGYNKSLDKLIIDEVLFDKHYYLERVSANNTWIQTSKDNAMQRSFDNPYPFGNSLVIGLIGDSDYFVSNLSQ